MTTLTFATCRLKCKRSLEFNHRTTNRHVAPTNQLYHQQKKKTNTKSDQVFFIREGIQVGKKHGFVKN